MSTTNQTNSSMIGYTGNSTGADWVNMFGSIATMTSLAMEVFPIGQEPPPETASIGTLSVGTLSVSTLSIGTLQVGAVSSMPVATTTSKGEVTPPPSPTQEAGGTSESTSGDIARSLALIIPIISAVIIKMVLLGRTIGVVGEVTEESLISKMFDWGKSALINSKNVISGYLNSGIAGVKSAMTSIGGWMKTNKVMLGIKGVAKAALITGVDFKMKVIKSVLL